MANLNFSNFYQVPNLKFDIQRMRDDLNKVLKKKKFESPGITHFGAIPLNQIPGDENSIKGNNIRGVYWTKPDESGKEVSRDIKEGADMIMVKPGMLYLDIIKLVKENFKIPVFSYQVSGEYSLLKMGIQKKILKKEAIYESIISLKRAGSNGIVSYFALEIAKDIKKFN